MAFETAASRRRFYLDRGLRRASTGSGSDLALLMRMPRDSIDLKPEDVFGDIRAVVAGGVATRAYAPERFTKDIDYLIDHDHFDEACRRLYDAGWDDAAKLVFPNASLGLYGRSFCRASQTIDIIASPQPWAAEALLHPQLDQTGLTVIGLAYLVLMKIDSARGVDQGDLTRMLGRIDERRLAEVVRIVAKHSHDPQAAGDVLQYAALGRMEYQSE